MRWFVIALAVLAAGAVLFLFFEAGEDPAGTTGMGAGTGPAPARSLSPSSPQTDYEADAGPAAGTGSGTASGAAFQPEERELAGLSFDERLAAMREADSKAAYAEMLIGWRTGRLTPEQDRKLGSIVGSTWSVELDQAAGQLLLEGRTTPKQAEGLSNLLAASSSEVAIGYLLEASERLQLLEARAALATVAEPGVLPLFIRSLSPDTSPETLQAVLGALRQMDTPKARDLEEQIRSWLP